MPHPNSKIYKLLDAGMYEQASTLLEDAKKNGLNAFPADVLGNTPFHYVAASCSLLGIKLCLSHMTLDQILAKNRMGNMASDFIRGWEWDGVDEKTCNNGTLAVNQRIAELEAEEISDAACQVASRERSRL